jgi:hypothetical protein
MGSKRDLKALHDDLRATTEDIAADASQLAEVESEKGKLNPTDPALVPLAKEAAELGEQIALKTASELDLAQEGSSRGGETSTGRSAGR